MDITALCAMPLFQSCSEQEVRALLAWLGAGVRRYEKGAFIYTAGSQVDHIGLVLAGTAQIERTDAWGDRVILHALEPGGVFAVACACIPDQPLLVNVTASSDCEVLFLNVPRLLQPGDARIESVRNRVVANLLIISAKMRLQLLRRSFHTAPKTIRGRVMSYLMEQAELQQSRRVTIPFDRQQMADYLGLDRSALSKELGRMRRDGLLEFRKNVFVLDVEPTSAMGR